MNCPEILQEDYGSSFCAACAMVAASNCLGSSVTVDQAIEDGAVASNGYVNRWSDYITIGSTKTVTLSSGLTKIKSEIDNDRPVIIYVTPSHYVVAYEATGTTTSAISVMDPLKGYTTLQELLTRKTWSGYKLCSD